MDMAHDIKWVFVVGVLIVLAFAFRVSLSGAHNAYLRDDWTSIVVMYAGPILGLLVFWVSKLTAFYGPLLWLIAVLTPPHSIPYVPGYFYFWMVVAYVLLIITLIGAGLWCMVSWSFSTTHNRPTIAEHIGSLALWVFFGWLFGATVAGLAAHI